MKNVVFGLFDEIVDARRVLEQLADSPLDLDAVQIVHADPDVQRTLADEIGLPRDRTVPTGLIIGAVLGAVLGALAGTTLLAGLGPLLSASAGTLLGAAGGAAVGAVAETIRLPEAHADELSEAIGHGATAVLVRTSNLPTARAISDLFYAGGARTLSPMAAASEDTDDSSPFAPSAYFASSAGLTSMAGDTDAPDEEHELFAPPWRRTPFAARPKTGIAAGEAVLVADATEPDKALTIVSEVAVDDRPVEALGLPPRVTTALVSDGITTVASLSEALQGGDETLLAIHGIGPKAIEQIRSRLDTPTVHEPTAPEADEGEAAGQEDDASGR